MTSGINHQSFFLIHIYFGLSIVSYCAFLMPIRAIFHPVADHPSTHPWLHRRRGSQSPVAVVREGAPGDGFFRFETRVDTCDLALPPGELSNWSLEWVESPVRPSSKRVLPQCDLTSYARVTKQFWLDSRYKQPARDQPCNWNGGSSCW